MMAFKIFTPYFVKTGKNILNLQFLWQYFPYTPHSAEIIILLLFSTLRAVLYMGVLSPRHKTPPKKICERRKLGYIFV